MSFNSDLLKIGYTALEGFGISMVVSIPVNVGNQTTIARSSNFKLPYCELVKTIYKGTLPGPASTGIAGWKNFNVGWSAHIIRELPRSLIRSAGAHYLLPYLKNYYNIDKHPSNMAKVNDVFAKIMAIAELILMPIDCIRVRMHGRKTWFPSIEEAQRRNRLALMSQGALLNSVRQYHIWRTWVSTRPWSQRFVLNTFNLDAKKDFSGLVAQSAIQAVPITLASFPLERIKNYLQLHSDYGDTLVLRSDRAFKAAIRGQFLNVYEELIEKSRYVIAFKKVTEKEGAKSLLRGAVPKTISIFFLVIGFNYQTLVGEQKKPI